jgi:DUF4097 and DUF4098 domain-containing protein YvlB
MFGVIMSMLKWEFTKLGTFKYETNSYEIEESFRNVLIDIDTADITVLPSEDGEVKVVCKEKGELKYSVSVENDTLIVRLCDNRKWYDYIGISTVSSEITVYLPSTIVIPEDQYNSLVIKASTADVDVNDLHFRRVDIKTSTGDINIGGVSTGDMSLSVTTGRIEASDIICENVDIKVSTGKSKLISVKCRSLTSKGNTGKVSLIDVIAREKLEIERTTGDITFDRCDAGEIHVETDTGNVHGSLLSEKIFVTRTDTGRVSVPQTTAGGICEITTDTGNIIIDVK